MIKAIAFDFDYTLGDSTQGIVLSANYALERLQYQTKSVEEIKKTIGLTLKETFRALTQSENVEDAEQFAVFFKKKADEVMTENTQLYSGVKELLQRLKDGGYRLAIVTTKYHYRINHILSKFDAADLIDKIVGGDDVKVEKPDPEGVLSVLEAFGMTKEELLYVGDSLVDARTARNAGVTFAAVLTGTTAREDFQAYDCVCIGEGIADIYRYVMGEDV